MFIVNRKIICRNAEYFRCTKTKMAFTLNEAITYFPLHKPLKSREYQIFNVVSDNCIFEFNVILSDRDISIVFSGMATRVYDYSQADEAREFIKIMAHLMGCYSFEEEE